MKFCVFGSINIDIFFSVPHIAGPGETLSAQSVSRSAGGKGANQAAALASAGCDVFMAGKIGADGRWILHILGQSGVNTDYTDTIDGYTGQAVIQVDQSGENSIILYSGGNGTITRDYVDSVLSHFQPGDVLLVQNETSKVPDMIRRGKERGMTVCLQSFSLHPGGG